MRLQEKANAGGEGAGASVEQGGVGGGGLGPGYDQAGEEGGDRHLQ